MRNSVSKRVSIVALAGPSLRLSVVPRGPPCTRKLADLPPWVTRSAIVRAGVGVANCCEGERDYGEADGDVGLVRTDGSVEEVGEFGVVAPFARGFVGKLAARAIDFARTGGPFAGIGGTEHRDCGWKGAGHIREQIVA